MQVRTIARRVIRAKLTHILGIAACAFTLAAVVVGSLASPTTSRPVVTHTFRQPVELLPAIIGPGGVVQVPGPAPQPARVSRDAGRPPTYN